jgi:hypothetical protein
MSKIRFWFAVLACLLIGGIAEARTLTAATVTNSSTQMIAGSQGPRVFLSIDNESGTATISCNITGGTAAANTAGSYTIGPGLTRIWEGSQQSPLIGGAVNCISSAASSPATIEAMP